MIIIVSGLICIAISLVTFHSYKKAAYNKKINRHTKNKDRLMNTLMMLSGAKKKPNQSTS